MVTEELPLFIGPVPIHPLTRIRRAEELLEHLLEGLLVGYIEPPHTDDLIYLFVSYHFLLVDECDGQGCHSHGPAYLSYLWGQAHGQSRV